MTRQILCSGGIMSPEPRMPPRGIEDEPRPEAVFDYLCSIPIIAPSPGVPGRLEHVTEFRIPVDKKKER